MCVIKAGQRRSKLEPSQTSAIILHAAKEPAERMRAVEEMMQKASIHTDPLVAKFGLKVCRLSLLDSLLIRNSPSRNCMPNFVATFGPALSLALKPSMYVTLHAQEWVQP